MMKEIFPGVFREGKKLYTLNAVHGRKAYGERLLSQNGKEYREWACDRSKLAAAISNNMRMLDLSRSSKILYLGASTGTTVSHLSDICSDGIIYAVEFAERVFHSLLTLSAVRRNIVPIMADARKFEGYRWLEEVDAVFCDIAQPDEIEIALRNADEFLKKNGILMISIKSQSIDVTKKSSAIYEAARKKVQAKMEVLEVVSLEPHERNHALLVARK